MKKPRTLTKKTDLWDHLLMGCVIMALATVIMISSTCPKSSPPVKQEDVPELKKEPNDPSVIPPNSDRIFYLV